MKVAIKRKLEQCLSKRHAGIKSSLMSWIERGGEDKSNTALISLVFVAYISPHPSSAIVGVVWMQSLPIMSGMFVISSDAIWTIIRAVSSLKTAAWLQIFDQRICFPGLSSSIRIRNWFPSLWVSECWVANSDRILYFCKICIFHNFMRQWIQMFLRCSRAFCFFVLSLLLISVLLCFWLTRTLWRYFPHFISISGDWGERLCLFHTGRSRLPKRQEIFSERHFLIDRDQSFWGCWAEDGLDSRLDFFASLPFPAKKTWYGSRTNTWLQTSQWTMNSVKEEVNPFNNLCCGSGTW